MKPPVSNGDSEVPIGSTTTMTRKSKIAAGIVFFFLWIFIFVYLDLVWGLFPTAITRHSMMLPTVGYYVLDLVIQTLVYMLFIVGFIVILWELLKKTTKFKKSILIGTLTGVVLGICFLVVEVTTLYFLSLNSYVDASSHGVVIYGVGKVVGGILQGILFGLLFAAIYTKLPGKSLGIQGTSFGIMTWVCFPYGLLSSRFLNDALPLGYMLYSVVIGGFCIFTLTGLLFGYIQAHHIKKK